LGKQILKPAKSHGMKQLVMIIIILLCTQLLIRCNDTTAKNQSTQIAKDTLHGFGSQVKWGEHLVTVSACHDCHSPKDYTKPGSGLDSSHLLAGYIGSKVPDVNRKDAQTNGWAITKDQTAWIGSWGITFSSNLTSDSTGIGTWKEERFIYAIRNGKYNGMASDRNLLPTMPWVMYENMTDEELKAIFAYLKSTKPIKNKVPPPIPPIK
jgi:mono/diheme cytochrome c family protein